MLIGVLPVRLITSYAPVQPILDYEPLAPKAPPIWRRSVLVWVIICLIGYCFALIGPHLVTVGIVSLYAYPHGTGRMGELGVLGVPVQTVTEKLALTLFGVVIGVLGIGFVAYVPPSQAFQSRGITRL